MSTLTQRTFEMPGTAEDECVESTLLLYDERRAAGCAYISEGGLRAMSDEIDGERNECFVSYESTDRVL